MVGLNYLIASNCRGCPEGETSIPGLRVAADWRRNWRISGEECLAATIRMVSPSSQRRLKSLGSWEGRGGEGRGGEGRGGEGRGGEGRGGEGGEGRGGEGAPYQEWCICSLGL